MTVIIKNFLKWSSMSKIGGYNSMKLVTLIVEKASGWVEWESGYYVKLTIKYVHVSRANVALSSVELFEYLMDIYMYIVIRECVYCIRGFKWLYPLISMDHWKFIQLIRYKMKTNCSISDKQNKKNLYIIFHYLLKYYKDNN